ncbi:MAG: hypothetical protein ACI8U4_000939 [Natronomonas sp.]|jgi:hypothetical protein
MAANLPLLGDTAREKPMSPPLEDDGSEVSPPVRGDRCVEIELESGELVIYDQDNHRAWIQSDDAVELEAAA